jgi:cytochrome c-type biogenesis protein CcmH/NrfF
MRFKRSVTLLAAGLFAAASMAATGPGSKPTLEQVGNQVYCQCGCVTLLNRCPHLPSECESRAQLQTVILSDIQKGKTDPAIVQDLVGRFGVHVLAAPPAAGFDLTAWVLPGVILLIGLGVVLAVVRRWRAKVSGAAKEEPPAPVDAKIMAAVEEEMSRIEAMND